MDANDAAGSRQYLVFAKAALSVVAETIDQPSGALAFDEPARRIAKEDLLSAALVPERRQMTAEGVFADEPATDRFERQESATAVVVGVVTIANAPAVLDLFEDVAEAVA